MKLLALLCACLVCVPVFAAFIGVLITVNYCLNVWYCKAKPFDKAVFTLFAVLVDVGICYIFLLVLFLTFCVAYDEVEKYLERRKVNVGSRNIGRC